MKKLLTTVLAISSLLMTPSLVRANGDCCEMPSGVFASIYGGGNWFHDSVLTNGQILGFTYKTSFKSGYMFGGTLGYRCCDGIRLELDVGYRENEVDQIIRYGGGTVSVRTLEGSNRISALHYMANVVLETAVSLCDGCIRPFFGVGFGAATIDFQQHISDYSLNDKQTVFAYQLIMGIIYPICDCVDLGLEYRFFSHDELSMRDADDYELRSRDWLKSHSVLAQLRYTWGDLW